LILISTGKDMKIIYLTELKELMMDVRTTRKKYENFYTKVKRNPVLNRRFLYTSPYVFSKMVDKIIYVADALLPEREFSIVIEAHKKMNITAQEFDEFICSLRCAALILIIIRLLVRSLKKSGR